MFINTYKLQVGTHLRTVHQALFKIQSNKPPLTKVQCYHKCILVREQADVENELFHWDYPALMWLT